MDQFGRPPGLGPGNRRFKSYLPDICLQKFLIIFRSNSVWLEWLPVKQSVVGSNPTPGAMNLGDFIEHKLQDIEVDQNEKTLTFKFDNGIILITPVEWKTFTLKKIPKNETIVISKSKKSRKREKNEKRKKKNEKERE